MCACGEWVCECVCFVADVVGRRHIVRSGVLSCVTCVRRVRKYEPALHHAPTWQPRNDDDAHSIQTACRLWLPLLITANPRLRMHNWTAHICRHYLPCVHTQRRRRRQHNVTEANDSARSGGASNVCAKTRAHRPIDPVGLAFFFVVSLCVFCLRFSP